MKRLIIFVIILLISLCFSSCFMGLPKRDSNIDHYNGYRNQLSVAMEILPELESINSTEMMTFKYRYDPCVIFFSESVLLIANYSKEEYIKQRNKFIREYSFSNEPKVDSFGQICIPETTFNINSYLFNLLDTSNSEYPKHFGFLAYSDKKYSIAFLYFSDYDLDYIAVPVSKFIKKYYSYDW